MKYFFKLFYPSKYSSINHLIDTLHFPKIIISFVCKFCHQFLDLFLYASSLNFISPVSFLRFVLPFFYLFFLNLFIYQYIFKYVFLRLFIKSLKIKSHELNFSFGFSFILIIETKGPKNNFQ